MKLVWLVLFILYFKESRSEIVSYPSPGSELSVLCGCASATQYNKTIPIKCEDGSVILMEDLSFNMGDSSSNNCEDLDHATCLLDSSKTVISLEDRIYIYKKCSLQNSCDIKIGGEQQDKPRLVNYPFYCHSELLIHDISRVIDTVGKTHLFYFYGEKHIGRKIDCDCSVTCLAPIRLDVNFINLKPRTCSKVKLLSHNVHLFDSSTNGITMLYSKQYIGTDLKLEIRGMEPDVEDVIVFGVLQGVVNMTVKCGGCRNSTDDKSTTDPSSIDPNATVHSTLDGATGISHVATTILGGILAAVIIINIVGIALYCFIRHHKKQHKTSKTLANASGNSEQPLYETLAIRQDTV